MRIKANSAVERMFDTILEVVRYDYPTDAETHPKGDGSRDFPGEPPHADNRVPWDRRKWNNDRRYYSKRQAHTLCSTLQVEVREKESLRDFAEGCLVAFADQFNEIAPFAFRIGNVTLKRGKDAAQLEFVIESKRTCNYAVENTFTLGESPLKAIKLACAYGFMEGAKALPCVRRATFDMLRQTRQAVKHELTARDYAYPDVASELRGIFSDFKFTETPYKFALDRRRCQIQIDKKKKIMSVIATTENLRDAMYSRMMNTSGFKTRIKVKKSEKGYYPELVPNFPWYVGFHLDWV